MGFEAAHCVSVPEGKPSAVVLRVQHLHVLRHGVLSLQRPLLLVLGKTLKIHRFQQRALSGAQQRQPQPGEVQENSHNSEGEEDENSDNEDKDGWNEDVDEDEEDGPSPEDSGPLSHPSLSWSLLDHLLITIKGELMD